MRLSRSGLREARIAVTGALIATGMPSAWAAPVCAGLPCRAWVDAGYSMEDPVSGGATWDAWSLSWTQILDAGPTVIQEVRRSSRFDLSDLTLRSAGYFPLGPRDTLYAEIGYSPSARVQPRGVVQLAWNRALGEGWGFQLGVRQLDYVVSDVTIGELTAERYFGSERVAYSYQPVHSSAAGFSDGHRLQFGHYFPNGSNIQLVLFSGEEVEKLAGRGALLSNRVDSAALYGLTWIAHRWGLGWSAGYTGNGAPNISDRIAVGWYFRIQID